MFFKFARDMHGLYGGDEFAGKSALAEVRNMGCYLDAGVPRLHVPAAAVLVRVARTSPLLLSTHTPWQDHGGFRLLATCLLPIGHGTLAYGSDDQGRTVHTHDSELNAAMATAGARLNLAPHRVGPGGACMLATCVDIEVHAGADGRWYLVDAARVFPPEKPSLSVPTLLLETGADSAASTPLDVARLRLRSETAALLRGAARRIQLPSAALYVRAEDTETVAAPRNAIASALAGATIRGSALLVSGERGRHLSCTLRPELVRGFRQPLSSDAYTVFGRHGAAQHNEAVRAATRHLVESVCPRTARDLAEHRAKPAHARQLVQLLHERGINARCVSAACLRWLRGGFL